MNANTKIYAELVDWDMFKVDIKANVEDNNDGNIYGLFYVDFENEGNIYECCWYKTKKERSSIIKKEGIIIINQ